MKPQRKPFANLFLNQNQFKRFSIRLCCYDDLDYSVFTSDRETYFVYKIHCCYSVFTGIDCDLDCFLTVHRDILPACDSELTGAYNALAVLDGDTVSITHLDVDLWYDVLVSVQGTGK